MGRTYCVGGGVAVLGIALGLLLGGTGSVAGGGAGKAILPAGEFAKLVDHDVKVLKEALAKGTLDKKTTRKVRATAFMIAVYAQVAGAGALRDDALKIAKLAEEGKAQEAAALAAKLSPAAKGGKAAPVALEKQLDFENVMHQFASPRVGGFGWEKELGDLAESKEALTAAQLQHLALLGHKIAMIGHVADAYADEKNEGGTKTKKNWLTFAEQFRHAALAVAESAKAKNDAGTKAAVEKLNTTCVKCHDVFR